MYSNNVQSNSESSAGCLPTGSEAIELSHTLVTRTPSNHDQFSPVGLLSRISSLKVANQTVNGGLQEHFSRTSHLTETAMTVQQNSAERFARLLHNEERQTSILPWRLLDPTNMIAFHSKMTNNKLYQACIQLQEFGINTSHEIPELQRTILGSTVAVLHGNNSTPKHKPFRNMSTLQPINDLGYDKSQLPRTLVPKHGGKKLGRPSRFPQKLYQMLTDLEKQPNGTEMASFLPNSQAFKIHHPKDFMRNVVPKYFSMSCIASFQRQLRMYGFQQIATGPHRGAYFHKFFIQGQPQLCAKIMRIEH